MSRRTFHAQKFFWLEKILPSQFEFFSLRKSTLTNIMTNSEVVGPRKKKQLARRSDECRKSVLFSIFHDPIHLHAAVPIPNSRRKFVFSFTLIGPILANSASVKAWKSGNEPKIEMFCETTVKETNNPGSTVTFLYPSTSHPSSLKHSIKCSTSVDTWYKRYRYPKAEVSKKSWSEIFPPKNENCNYSLSICHIRKENFIQNFICLHEVCY